MAIQPDADTDRWLKNHRCVTRQQTGGILCSTQLGDDNGMFLPPAATDVLTFNLQMLDSKFALITDMSALAAQKAPLFSPTDGEVATGGSLQLSSREQALDSGVLAAIQIPGKVFAAPAHSPMPCFIDFTASQARWLYYYVTDLTLTGKDLQLVDQGTPGTPVVFGANSKTDLGKSPDPNDTISLQLAAQYPSFNRIRFASDSLVPAQEVPRQLKLQLDGHAFNDVLPAPDLQNRTMWPFGQQPGKQAALFQVVKYVSYSFSKNGV